MQKMYCELLHSDMAQMSFVRILCLNCTNVMCSILEIKSRHSSALQWEWNAKLAPLALARPSFDLAILWLPVFSKAHSSSLLSCLLHTVPPYVWALLQTLPRKRILAVLFYITRTCNQLRPRVTGTCTPPTKLIADSHDGPDRDFCSQTAS